MPASNEPQVIRELCTILLKQERHRFPEKRQPVDAPPIHGVYLIRKNDIVLHVGRTYRGQSGLKQRIRNHLVNASSFANIYLKSKGLTGAILRTNNYTFQYLELANSRKRALLEAYAIGTLCPKHMGLGENKNADMG